MQNSKIFVFYRIYLQQRIKVAQMNCNNMPEEQH